jgi:short-subunit dehydrogenase
MSSPSSRPCALITGASSGIGTAYAARLGRDGYDVVLVARRRDRLEALAERLRAEAGAGAEVLAADLTDAGALAEVEARAAGDPPVVLLVNNAGFGGYRPFVEVAPKVIDALIDIHIRAVARLTRAALPGMVRRGTGGVINVASLLAPSGSLPPNPLPHRAVYAGAKAFTVTFTQALAGEVAGTGVKVQVCLPGVVATEFHTIQGIDMSNRPRMTAEDVVAASLAAWARDEVVCVPALDDASLVERVVAAQVEAMRNAAFSPELASRYRAGGG